MRDDSWILYLIVGLVIAALIISLTPVGRSIWNKQMYAVQKADDATNYDTLKKVEDTCRAYMASYEKDKLFYEQYKDGGSKEEQTWAQQAKMRANNTAATYNNYILQNSFVWKDNVPGDIRMKLGYIG